MSKDDEAPPWAATGVKGIVPPGRKLSATDKRTAPWRSTGVRGVELSNRSDVSADQERWKIDRAGKKRRAPPARKPQPPPKPGVGQIEPQAQSGLKIFLDEIAEFFRGNLPPEECTVSLSELIGQSHAPYEIIMGFTVLSTVVGQDGELRDTYAGALERGARAYFNLAMRLDDSIKPPRGLLPQRLDPIFYDLPATAFQLPYAFGTDAYLKTMELLVGEPQYNRLLVELGEKLYARHIEGQRYGDENLSTLFPWERPKWAPER